MFYISCQIIRSLVFFLERQGMCSKQIEALLGERLKDLDDVSARFPIADYESLMHYGDKILQQEHIGLEFGNSLKAQNWGLLGHVALVSKNLEKALEHAQRLSKTIRNIGHIELVSEDEFCRLSWHAQSNIQHYMVDELFSSWLSFAKHCCHNHTDVSLEKVQLTRPTPTPESLTVYKQVFNCPIEFSANSNSLIFSKSILKCRLQSPNPELENILLSQVDTAVSQHDYASQLVTFINTQLPHIPTLEQASIQLNIKKRTLQRHLSNQQLSFSKLIDQQRKLLAKEMLLKGLSALEISNKLGFSEQSALQRAFKRWYKTTPKKFLALYTI
ncbi:MAG: AraC family transcriptional regulator [Pseudoalteromonas sp.]|uniref:AraC family transcriptional regulator n=1 Tax=Pseudoalteromonas sp. TaxID=53249 RepID=UPI0025DB9303|nr:AraC family transcriptional regulator [Pseudoalteromonas sp.]MCH2087393.1 AraC family transcriptional regulator [Pseudoalteromonas sp.]